MNVIQPKIIEHQSVHPAVMNSYHRFSPRSHNPPISPPNCQERVPYQSSSVSDQCPPISLPHCQDYNPKNWSTFTPQVPHLINHFIHVLGISSSFKPQFITV
uniref:Uncharacterized protein n=1 Tax=Octopus bimaculoides TaxID=37653 RepID=A0A0L8FIV9_OCTBM